LLLLLLIALDLIVIVAALSLVTLRSQPAPPPTPAAQHLPSVTPAPSPAPSYTPPPTSIASPAPQSPTPNPQPPSPIRAATKYGIHLLLDDGRKHWLPDVWPEHVAAARRIVGEGGYVVQLIRLDDLDIARWQHFLDLCAQNRLVPIIRLATPYDHDNKWWEAPPQDPDGEGYTLAARRFRDFFAQLRWPAEPRYAIVHNEPNRGDEWGNRPDPAEYARYLRDVGDALHQVGVTVLGPALDLYAPHSNGQPINRYVYLDAESFLDGMAAAEPRAFDVIDVWAAHAYPLDPFRFDPSRQIFQLDYAHGASNPRHVDPPEGLYNRGVNSYRWEMWKLTQITGHDTSGLPVMITESGWRHAPSQDPAAADHVHAEISFDTMSAYLDLAFNGNGLGATPRYPDLPATGWTPWNHDPQVLGVVLFALGGYPPAWGHTNWVEVDAHGHITAFYPIDLAHEGWYTEAEVLGSR
ncbi:MAG: hypothetical protein JXA93_09625, partial [Anaerolineae bacterium]|nr:hypothetical protein [Anaerolineae bacterium]